VGQHEAQELQCTGANVERLRKAQASLLRRQRGREEKCPCLWQSPTSDAKDCGHEAFVRCRPSSPLAARTRAVRKQVTHSRALLSVTKLVDLNSVGDEIAHIQESGPFAAVSQACVSAGTRKRNDAYDLESRTGALLQTKQTK
jgi:hypothetical protein